MYPRKAALLLRRRAPDSRDAYNLAVYRDQLAQIERLAMLRYGVDDLRLFFENDLQFLKQFS